MNIQEVKTSLFPPPVSSLVIAALFFFCGYFIAGVSGNGYYAIPFFSGFIVYYLFYTSMPYAIHAIKPAFKRMKALWGNHHLPHYKEEQKGFWDEYNPLGQSVLNNLTKR